MSFKLILIIYFNIKFSWSNINLYQTDQLDFEKKKEFFFFKSFVYDWYVFSVKATYYWLVQQLKSEPNSVWSFMGWQLVCVDVKVPSGI